MRRFTFAPALLLVAFTASSCGKAADPVTQSPDKQPAPVSPPTPQVAALPAGALYKIIKGKFYGFIDGSGNEVIPAAYEHATTFNEGFAEVEIGDKWGAIDVTGKMVVQPQFSQLGSFSSGLAPANTAPAFTGTRGWGYVNNAGTLTITPQFDDAQPFSEGLACVKVGDKYGFIDTTGKMVIQPQYSEAYSFAQGFASVKFSASDGPTYIDHTGKITARPDVKDSNGFSVDLTSATLAGGKLGYVATDGTIVIPGQFSEADPFSEGLAAVKLDGKIGYVDKKGTMVIAPQFEEGWGFSKEGLACVCLGNRYGYIDKSGKSVIAPQFFARSNFRDGLAFVLKTDTQPVGDASTSAANCAYIDVTGKEVWTGFISDAEKFNAIRVVGFK